MIKPIKEWKKVFLDTTVIIDFLLSPDRFEKNPSVKQRITATHKLLEYLISNPKDEVYFYISAVTLAELTKIGESGTLDDQLLELFSGSNIVFVDYTCETAIDINTNLKKYLPNYSVNQFLGKLESIKKDGGEFYQARQWVNDDLKISSVANSLKYIDVVLTGDNKTFVPIANMMNLPVLYTQNIPFDMFGEVDSGIQITVAT
ncbi:MAG: hypothetical protein QM503_04610 [Bacteroidota bacterium]